METNYIIKEYMGKKPIIPESCTIFENCVIMGDVRFGENCTVMPGCVLRAEYNPIIIGNNSNIQELTCIHAENGENGAVIIGENVTIGHKAMLHGCKIKDNTLIGMCATILNFSVIEENCLIGAASLVTENTVIPKGSVAFGSPAKVKRSVDEKDIEYINHAAKEYVEFAENYTKATNEKESLK